ncbi:MAG: lytic transglycosylase domain-containing protein [Bacteroidales bacterium]|nr:lytic transglycosylase domain-containing protein [Bacteroidales bacterium]
MEKNWNKGLSIIAIVLSVSAISMGIFIMAKDAPRNSEAQYRELVKENYQTFAAPFPDKVTFCGQEVPIDNILVREALDMELNLIMYNHSKTYLILKKAERYFPEIESILKTQNIPDDIKYLAVAESGLANLVSPAKAEGFWQFVLPTAKEYGLDEFEGWDERYDLEKSTIAACQYLRKKKAIFNDWALACASYNSGETGVKNRMKEQGCNNYWELYTNSETSRYVYRIIAYKLIMENPQQYGYYFRAKDTYQPIPVSELIIDSSINDLYAFAKYLDIPYKHLRNLNPVIRGSKIVNKKNKELKLYIPTKDGLSWENLTRDIKDEPVRLRIKE